MKRFPFPDNLEFLKNVKFSQRRFLFVVVGIATVILITFFGILPLIEAKKKAEEEITLKKRALLKYEQFLQNRKAIEEELNRTVKLYEEAQQKLLSGETPQLGAANLQEIVKRLSEKNGIGVRSFRILEPKEMDVYQKISLHIDLNPVNSMLSLGQFMYDIEHHEKGLMISEMDFLVFNPRMPNSIQGSLIISGLMNKTKTKEKGRQG
ncbi:MAG TPA: type II secretion system protein GspM [Thermodesulfobacteriota bacterium]|nr:type II secretion system protein GspM [Thermodesulfobacteriota bacterium]